MISAAVCVAGCGKDDRMPLSRYEQRVLDEIEAGVRTDDPAFATKLNLKTAGPLPAPKHCRRPWVPVAGHGPDPDRVRPCS